MNTYSRQKSSAVQGSGPEKGAGGSDRDQLSVDSRPLVTVALPVYNAGRYLRSAVLSIINQTFENWELLVIDDGSTDSAVHELADIDDARVKVYRDGHNQGIAVRLNEAIDMARGVYFARMDSDDISYPERFVRQVEMLQSDPTCDLVATRALAIDEYDNPIALFPSAIRHEEICARPWLGFHLPHPTWMGKIEWFRKYRYAIPAPYFCEDQELLLRSYLVSRFCTLDEILFGYRIRSGVDWAKLAGTRRAILSFQVRRFFNDYHLYFLLGAVLLYVIKTLRDMFFRTIGRHTSSVAWTKAGVLEEMRWENIRVEVSDR